jgi:cupin 2 domain-containing protein
MIVNNIFDIAPDKLSEEFFDTLISASDFKVERIISEGHASPPGFWYDQDKNEFVLLISGSAVLAFENDEHITLQKGDYIIIPSHKKHRVEKTDSAEKTFWLAIHF